MKGRLLLVACFVMVFLVACGSDDESPGMETRKQVDVIAPTEKVEPTSIPDSSLVYLEKGKTFDEMGQLDKAIENYEEANRLDPSNPEIVHTLTYALGKRGINYTFADDFVSALNDFNRVIELDPEEPSSYMERGNIHRALGNHDSAISDFTKALDLSGHASRIYRFRAFAFVEVQDWVSAIDDFNKAIQYFDGDVDPIDAYDLYLSYYGRGLAFYRLEEYQKAVSDLSRSIELEPEFLDALAARGFVYVELGDLEAALTDFDEFLLRVPDDNPDRSQIEQYAALLRSQ